MDTLIPAARSGLGRRALLGRSAAVAGVAGAATLLSAAPALAADDLPAAAAWDVGVLGDSLSAHGNYNSQATGARVDGLCYFRSDSYLGAALPLTRGRFHYAGAWATGGYTTSQVLAAHLPQVLAARPTVCVVLMGSNDIGRLTSEQTRDNIGRAVTALLLAGITPVLATIPPKDTVGAAGVLQVDSLNIWLRRFARARQLALVDFHTALVNPSTGRYAAGLTTDGVHPTWVGVTRMGRALGAVLSALPGASPALLLDCYTPNGALLTDVTHSTGTSWTLAGSSTDGAYSRRSSPSWIGAKGIVTGKTRTEFGLYGRLATQPTPGHRIQFASVLDVPVVPAGGSWTFALLDRVNGTVVCGYYACNQPVTNAAGDATVVWEFDMPELKPGSELVVVSHVRGAVGLSVGLAQTTLLDLTALGLA